MARVSADRREWDKRGSRERDDRNHRACEKEQNEHPARG